MKRYPKFCSILLFAVAVLGFLLGELYFFMNPMYYRHDFIMLYHGPILLFLLSLAAAMRLHRVEHSCARGLFVALAFFYCTVMIGVNAWAFAEDFSIQVLYYPYNLSLWFSLSLLVSAALSSALLYRAHAKSHPKLCCALLFTLALCCALLGGLSFFTSPFMELDYPGWYLGALLLFLLSLAAAVGLYRIGHRCARGLLIALACAAIVATLIANAWIHTRNTAVIAEVYPRHLALWLALPLLFYAAFTGVLAWKKQVAPRVAPSARTSA